MTVSFVESVGNETHVYACSGGAGGAAITLLYRRIM